MPKDDLEWDETDANQMMRVCISNADELNYYLAASGDYYIELPCDMVIHGARPLGNGKKILVGSGAKRKITMVSSGYGLLVRNSQLHAENIIFDGNNTKRYHEPLINIGDNGAGYFSNCEFRNCKSVNANTFDETAAIESYSNSTINMTNCYIHDIEAMAIVFGSSTDSKITGTTITSCGGGILSGGPLEMNNLTISNCQADGIQKVNASTTITVNNSIISGCHKGIWNYAGTCKINGCQIYSNPIGINNTEGTALISDASIYSNIYCHCT